MKNRDLMRKNTLFIIRFAIISRLLIFLRDMVTASRLGVSYKMDSYILALSTLMLVTKIVGDGIIVALIPLLQEIQGKFGTDKKVEYTNNLVNITILISLVLFVTGFLGAPIIMRIFGPGFGEMELEKAIVLFRIGLPIVAFYWLKSIGGAYLQSEHAFKAGAKGGVSYELVLIAYLLFFAKEYELKGFMVATILAVLSQVYLIFSTMRKKGYRYEFRMDFKDRYLGKAFLFLLPIAIILMIMAEPIVKIFFERGAFGWEASFFTSQALVFYAFGLPAMALLPLVTRAYYSIQDMQTPAIISIVTLVINTILNLTLAPLMGGQGIALATSLATIVAVVIGAVDLNRRLKFARNKVMENMVMRLILSSSAMIISIGVVYALISITTENILLYNIATVGLSSLVGISSYALVYKKAKLEFKIE